METIPWNLIFWSIVVWIAFRVLMSQSLTLRDRLKKLLVDHVSEERRSINKKVEIARLQKKMRELKERQRDQDGQVETEAPSKKRAA